jgi:DNA replication protein DnaC
VLDDLGAEENTMRAKMKLTEIISERHGQRRLTVITMNDDVLKLEDIYGRRMAERVLGSGHTVFCSGESMRLTG